MSREALPKNVKFENYQIELTPNFETFKYSGTERITLSILEPTDTIVLNSHEITVNSATLKNGNIDISADISYDEKTQRVMLTFQYIQPVLQSDQTYELYVDFTGTHNDMMAGFYRSKYTDQDGNERYMMTTQFEATDARRAFPCGDEPSLKATFDVTLNVPKELTALSNMPVQEEYEHPNNPNLKTVKFERTPIMSTYLLAFYVGQVEYIEKVVQKPGTGENLKVRVYTPIGKSGQGEFALDLASKVLGFFSEYFALDYPLPKMDLIAIPDFSAGAMENWGLVTFRTKYLLYEEGVTSMKMKSLIAYIVCHELAHQWFGNLVTMEWWSDLWLNEGFATWVGWMATNHFFPEWKVWEMFIMDEHNEALELDRLSSSHPITNSVTKATEVNEIFDTITYSKGACIIRMLVNYLGEFVFRSGLRSYLKYFQYSNAKTEDLWKFLSDASGTDVSDMMSSWTDSMGYPLVTVNKSDNMIHLTQSKYCDPNSKQRWTIPLNIIKANEGEVDRVGMTDHEYIFNNPGGGWFKLNYEEIGFYLTQYDQNSLSKLGDVIATNVLGPIDRAEIINTQFSLASNGYCSVKVPLDYLKFYNHESEYIVWSSIVSGINGIKDVWFDNKYIHENLDNIVIPMLMPILDRLGWESSNDESYQNRQLRTMTISSLGRTTKVVEEAKSRLDRYIGGDTNALSADIRGTVFKIMVKSNDEYFNKLMEYYNKVEANEIQIEIITALGSTRNMDLLVKAFDFSYKSGKVRLQDSFYVGTAAAVSMGGPGRIVNWNYIMDNWKTICDLYKGGKYLLGRIVGRSVEGLYDKDVLNRAESFLTEHKDDTIEIQNILKQSYEKARRGIEWMERDTNTLLHHCHSNSTNGPLHCFNLAVDLSK